MADKKIIEKKNIKENNPNDDEEVLKNNEEYFQTGPSQDNTKEPKTEKEKPLDPEITGIS